MIICRVINRILYILSIFFLVCFCVSLFANDLFFDKLEGFNYKKTYHYEYPFSGIDNICVDDEFVYCFNQYFQAVNVYDKQGNYTFTIKVPKSENGSGYMYMKDDKLWIKNNFGDFYVYKKEKFIEKISSDEDIEFEEEKTIDVTDKNGDVYSVSLFYPTLMKNEKVIMRPSFLKTVCSAPVLSFIYYLLSEVLYLLSEKIIKIIILKFI